MTTQQFEIRFDGDVPGLAEHKLDLNAFGKSLATFSDVVRDALIDTICKKTEVTRRTATEMAKQIPLFLLSIEPGCAKPRMEIEIPDGEGFTANDVFETVVDWMQEGFNTPSRHKNIGKFYKYLPSGVTSFDIIYDGGTKFSIDPSTRAVNDLNETASMVYLDIYDAELITVGPLSAPFVELSLAKGESKINGGAKIRCKTTKEIARKIFDLGDSEVRSFKVQALYSHVGKRYKVVNAFEHIEDTETNPNTPIEASRFNLDEQEFSYWQEAFEDMKASGD